MEDMGRMEISVAQHATSPRALNRGQNCCGCERERSCPLRGYLQAVVTLANVKVTPQAACTARRRVDIGGGPAIRAPLQFVESIKPTRG
eukprot:5417591-Pleurochrysis_carterae.AAC.1